MGGGGGGGGGEGGTPAYTMSSILEINKHLATKITLVTLHYVYCADEILSSKFNETWLCCSPIVKTHSDSQLAMYINNNNIIPFSKQ